METRSRHRLCFAFTGPGAQWRHMGEALLKFEVFRTSIEKADKFLNSLGCYWSITEALFADYFSPDWYGNINDAQLSQPLCTAIQIALVDLLESWKIKPSFVVGHSLGEIAAAYCSGAISRETAWAISYYCGQSVWEAVRTSNQACSMTIIQLSADRLSPYLSPWNYSCVESDRITIACYDSPSTVIVSGPVIGLGALELSLQQHGVLFTRLNVDFAPHSRHMDKAAEIYRQLLGPDRQMVNLNTNNKPIFISSVTGSEVKSYQLQTADYWVFNLLQPVKFNNAMSDLLSSTMTIDYILEIGPDSTLNSPIRAILQQSGQENKVCYASALVRDRDAFETILNPVGKLYCSGHKVDLQAISLEMDYTEMQSIWDKKFQFWHVGRREMLDSSV